MTLGSKLARLRKEHNYTQEQLANILGVSRQAISKWESDAAYPETEKLIKLGELYDCSMDYLLKDGEKSPVPKSQTAAFNLGTVYFERKSEKTIHGLPLWHVNIGLGRSAKGIIAVGLAAKGVISIGLCSLGILSFGLLSVGIVALGNIAAGLLAAGAISVGVITFGAVSVGIIAIGALSVGQFSYGALAIGNYFAAGDEARALIALGDSKATGDLYQKLGELSAQDVATIKELLDANVPPWLSWAKELVKLFI